jgi:tetratricopeptide (TPR) repeat protein
MERSLSALEPAWKEELSGWLPLSPEDPGRSERRSRPPDQAHRIRQEAFVQAFLILSRSRPLVLALDDLPKADAASLEGLHRLLERAAAQALPVLVVGTRHTGEVREGIEDAFLQLIERLETRGLLRKLLLPPLSEVSVAQLLNQLSGEPVPDALIEQLSRASGGNPLLLLALLEHLHREGKLHLTGGRWEVVGEIEGLSLPEELSQLIERKLETLSVDERALLEAVAVLGQRFDYPLIRKVLGWPRARTADALEGAQQAALLVKENGAYRFAHELYRERIYGQIDPIRRRDLHWAIAETLRALDPQPLQALAEHYELAGDPERALSYVLDALKEAGDAWRTTEALALAERALGLIERLEQEAERRVVTLSRRDLLKARIKVITFRERMNDGLGRREAQAEDLQKLRMLACALRSRAYLAESYNRRAVLCWRVGKLDEGARHAERALRWARRAKDRRREGAALHNLGLICWQQGRLQEGLEYVKAAYRTNQELGEKRWQASALNTLAGIYKSLGDIGQTLTHLERACALYRHIEDARYEANALHNLGASHEELGDQEQAESHYRRALQRFRLVGDRLGEAATLIRLADLDREHGDLKAAMEQLEIAYTIHQEISDPEGEFEALLAMAEVYKARREWEEGLARLQKALKLAEEHGFAWLEAIARLEMAVLLIEKGDPKEALPWAEEGVARMEEMELRDYLPKGCFQLYRALRALGHHEKAFEHLEKAYREVRRQAEGLPNEALKRQFESTHQEILEAWEWEGQEQE